MADSKISALTELSAAPATGDLLVLVDISDTTMAASGTNKKITWANLTVALTNGTTTMATSQAQTFTSGVATPTLKPTAASASSITLATGATTTPVFDVIGGSASSLAMRFTDVTTDATTKQARFVSRHYTNSEEDVLMFYGNNFSSQNQVNLGGGSSLFNAVTDWRIYAAATTTTTTGTTVARITVTGIAAGHTNTPSAWLDAAASASAQASMRIRAGSRPTTPNTGDIWDDGALVAYQVNSTTNAVVNSLKLERGSSGTPAAGFGLGIVAQLESSTTDTQDAGRLTWAWSTATHASRAAVGILSAYYTSTEREAIRWVADSSTVKVGIAGVTSPSEALEINGRLSSLSVGGTTAGFWFKDASANARGFVGLSDDSASPKVGIYNAGYGAYLFTGDSSGRVGIGATTSPQGLIHGHDGSGGFLFVNQASVGGTAVTIIPNGTGDITECVWFAGRASNSAAFTSDISPTTLVVSSSTTKTDGANTLTIAVAADGSMTLQATAGAATWKVFMWMIWR